MTKLKIDLSKGDILEIVTLINEKRATLLDSGYDNICWEYYFYLAELEDKLVK